MKHQKLKSTRQTPRPQTAELTDDHSSSQRFTIFDCRSPWVHAIMAPSGSRIYITIE
ncbi:hypothetical protein L208DRAFT_1384891 [Tricholoma matsutake]|nr:hypothetical protein L208DRAFT_1384891 [Tricholoma matsutake 945]